MKIIKNILLSPIYGLGFVVGFVKLAYYDGEYAGNNFRFNIDAKEYLKEKNNV